MYVSIPESAPGTDIANGSPNLEARLRPMNSFQKKPSRRLKKLHRARPGQMPVIPALKRQRKEDKEFKASLGNVRLSHKNKADTFMEKERLVIARPSVRGW